MSLSCSPNSSAHRFKSKHLSTRKQYCQNSRCKHVNVERTGKKQEFDSYYEQQVSQDLSFLICCFVHVNATPYGRRCVWWNPTNNATNLVCSRVDRRAGKTDGRTGVVSYLEAMFHVSADDTANRLTGPVLPTSASFINQSTVHYNP
jgi:hypothetical protein